MIKNQNIKQFPACFLLFICATILKRSKMKFVELKKTLKNKIDNVYILSGSDRFLQSKSMKLISSNCVDNFLEMNETIYNDENLDVQKCLEIAQTLPFMSRFRVIFLKDCISKLTETNKKDILEYLKKPVATTVLVFVADERTEFLKKCEKYATPVDCDYLDIPTLTKVVASMCAENKKQITANALNNLIEYCGYDLSKIGNEVVKLASYCEGSVIKPEDIEINVAKTMDYEMYRIANAIIAKDTSKAIHLYEYMLREKGSTQYILGALANFMRRYFYLQVTKHDRELCKSVFKIGDYPIKMMITETDKLKKVELMNSLHAILATDYNIKAGHISDVNSIYSLIMNIVDKL